MNRRRVAPLLGAALVAPAAARAAAGAEPLRYVLHVGGANPALMEVAIGNIRNILATGPAPIVLVANGLGYTMLRADTSPVRADVEAVLREHPAVVFAACQNSRAAVARREGKAPADIPEIAGVTDVPAGIVKLAELQAQGWAYIRV